MGAESTEKRSVIYVTAKIQDSRMRQEQMEKFAATTGNDTMFGEDDINFDLQLEKFGVNTNILKEPAVQRIFRAWVEDWEQDARKKMTLWRRRNCFRSIEVLSFMIPTLTMVFAFMIKTWSSVVGEEMDGLC
jgi:hypothetical protein